MEEAFGNRGPTRDEIPVWPFLVVAGTIVIPIGYVTGLFAALPTGGDFSCTHGSANALIPIVGPILRVSDFGPRYVGTSTVDCGENRAPVVAVAIVSEVLQLGGVAAYGAAAIAYANGGSKHDKHGSFMVLPGAPGAPLGATLSVVSF